MSELLTKEELLEYAATQETVYEAQEQKYFETLLATFKKALLDKAIEIKREKSVTLCMNLPIIFTRPVEYETYNSLTKQCLWSKYEYLWITAVKTGDGPHDDNITILCEVSLKKDEK